MAKGLTKVVKKKNLHKEIASRGLKKPLMPGKSKHK